jgi:hypothetical protein
MDVKNRPSKCAGWARFLDFDGSLRVAVAGLGGAK